MRKIKNKQRTKEVAHRETTNHKY